MYEFESHRGHTMKEVIIQYNEPFTKAYLSLDNTSIVDSYKIRDIKGMSYILKELRKIVDNSFAINKRNLFGMICEWGSHNLLYILNIKRERTKTVDLNMNQSVFTTYVYTLLFIFYIIEEIFRKIFAYLK